MKMLDIQHRPNGDVVISRYPFETVFHEDEWKELSEYCLARLHTQTPNEPEISGRIKQKIFLQKL
jgi:hypothetical protein